MIISSKTKPLFNQIIDLLDWCIVLLGGCKWFMVNMFQAHISVDKHLSVTWIYGCMMLYDVMIVYDAIW